MSDKALRSDPKGYETHQSTLESRYIEDYLRMKGCCKDDLPLLPKETARRLMIEASRYASMKLAEHEARARLRQDIRCE
jgi:hypothetical protein